MKVNLARGTRAASRKALLAYSTLGLGLAVWPAAMLAHLPSSGQSASNLALGRRVYAAQCAACHGARLEGGPGGPALLGPAFQRKWASQPRDRLTEYVQATMPPGAAGSLSANAYGSVVSLILQRNGVGIAASEGVPSRAASAETVLPAPRTASARFPGPILASHSAHDTAARLLLVPAARVREEARLATLNSLRPVTDEMLRQPPDGSWLHWRRTYDGQGFSPLREITRQNVSALRLAWSWQLAPGLNEITPLVHDGVLFIMSGGRLDALNAASGDLLWQYTAPEPHGILRNLAITGNRLVVAAGATVLALDARTGRVVWNTPIAEPGPSSKITGGPLVVKGKILQGMGFCVTVNPSGCFIVALDAQTGEEIWRFDTIAKPGELGGDTWNDLPVDQRAGASVWLAGSYDPELDLLFFGTGQTYQTGNLVRGSKRAAALFTDTTLALKPETGKLAWHFQHQDGDVWDLDWSFERVVANLTVDGTARRTVTTGGKIGVFDTLDAATGKYLFSTDVGFQTLVRGVDPVTGAKHIDPADVPALGKLVDVCPGTLGGRNWPATAYNPQTRVLFVPFNDTCTRLGHNLSQQGGGLRLDPRDPEGRVGRVQAIDLDARKTLWTRRERSPQASAVLATAGGLIFEGNRDRWFRASDDRMGKVLWQTRLNASPSSYPITYSVNGTQYVAVTAGGGNFLDTLIGGLTPEITTTTGQPTLWIFRLPQS